MSEYSRNEADVLDAVQHLSAMVPGGRTVKAAVIVDRAWQNGRGLTYDQTFRALSSLVRKGALERVVRGYYREVDR